MRHTARLLPAHFTRALTICLPAVLLATSAQAELGLVGSEFLQYPLGTDVMTGTAVAAGDFNGDGIDDIALGSPQDYSAGFTESGRTRLGLSNPDGSIDWHDIYYCLNDSDRDTGWQIGSALVFGHFDDDEFADLAIGMPGAAAGGVAGAGAVCILYGEDVEALTFVRRQKFSQDLLVGAPENQDFLDMSLAAGDLDGDDLDELVIGLPNESVGAGMNETFGAGAVHVIFGDTNGLTTAGNLLLSRGQGLPGTPETNESVGWALAIGNFMGDSFLDLAVGAPGDGASTIGGSVEILWGSDVDPLAFVSDPLSVDSVFWDFAGTAESGDGFGRALAAGDFDGDGDTDLAIGIPYDDDLGLQPASGAVMVIQRVGPGLVDTGELVLWEGLFPGVVEANDAFGSSLVAGDFDHDGHDDLVIGSDNDNVLGNASAGQVRVVYGSPSGLDATDFQAVNMFYFGGLEAGDRFGHALAAGKLKEPHGGVDLLVGVPYRDFQTDMVFFPDEGGLAIVQNVMFFADGFETGDFSAWTSVEP